VGLVLVKVMNIINRKASVPTTVSDNRIVRIPGASLSAKELRRQIRKAPTRSAMARLKKLEAVKGNGRLAQSLTSFKGLGVGVGGGGGGERITPGGGGAVFVKSNDLGSESKSGRMSYASSIDDDGGGGVSNYGDDHPPGPTGDDRDVSIGSMELHFAGGRSLSDAS
jgi:hypothetical protein